MKRPALRCMLRQTAALPPDVRKAYGFPYEDTFCLLRLCLPLPIWRHSLRDHSKEGLRKGRAFPHIRRQSRRMRSLFVWTKLWSGVFFLLATGLLLPLVSPSAQDQRELEAEKIKSSKLKGEHPLVELMRSRKSSLRPELMGVHPRVYVTEKELDELRQRARTTHRDLWQQALRKVRALKTEPAAPPAQQRRAQNEVGIGIAEAAFAYKIEGDRKYLEAANKYMDAAGASQ